MSKIAFLPTGYQSPKTTNFYMKFVDGENRFRILSQPILGWEDWHEKTPLRYRFDNKPLKPIDPKKPIKHFWAMIVWNYLDEEIQILHITQSSIRKGLEALCCDNDWGSPYFYDLKVIKTGEGLESQYVINPIPHKPLSPHIQQKFYERRCNLDALFFGDDPFSKDNSYFTEGIFDSAPVNECKLTMILNDCDHQYRNWFYTYIKNEYHVNQPSLLPVDVYEKAKKAAFEHMHTYNIKKKNEEMSLSQDNLFMEGAL